ncbi:MAG TPA: ABC transporter permease [Actinocrinis sp.]|jgi:ABC-2 type transport system permease protein
MAASDAELDLTPAAHSRAFWALSDIWELTKRSLLHIRQDPDQLVSVTVQPVILVVLLRYMFGGAIDTGGGESYINFLMAGVFIETAALTATSTSTAVAVDLRSGATDRFRSLPMVTSAVPAGQVIADLARSVVGMAVMVGLGLAVGFRPHAGVSGWLGAIGLTLLVTFALSWIAACLGMLGGSVEAVQQFGLVLIIPILFSSAFVPTRTMPGWLRVVADNQPMTHAIDAVRALLLGQPTGGQVQATLLWFCGLTVAAVAMAGYLFRLRTSR